MENKYFSVEEMNSLIENLELAFTDYGDKADTLISKCKEFQNDDSFTGERATVVKDLVGDNEVSLVNAQKDMQAKLLSMYKHAADSFAEKVDSAPNARLDLETLDMVESDLKAIYRDVDTTCAEIENIAKEMNAKYGHFGHITVPNADPLRESLENLCGGYNPEAGFYHDLKQKFINWDEEECAYIESQLLSDEIEKANSSVIQIDTKLDSILSNNSIDGDNLFNKKNYILNNHPKILFNDDSDEDTDDEKETETKPDNNIFTSEKTQYLKTPSKLLEEITGITNSDIKEKIFKKNMLFLMERYSFSDEEMDYMIENYEQDLISLYWTTKLNSSEADKICQKINRKWCKEGKGYLEYAHKLVEQYNITDEQKECVYNLEKLIGITKYDVEYTKARVAGYEVLAAALFEHGDKVDFISCVLGNACAEGCVGEIETYSNKEYIVTLSNDLKNEKGIDYKNTFSGKLLYELDNGDLFLNYVNYYRKTNENQNVIVGIGACQWSYRDRNEGLIDFYKAEMRISSDEIPDDNDELKETKFNRNITFSEAARAEAAWLISELDTGEYKDCDDNYYRDTHPYIKNDFKLDKNVIIQGTTNFFADYERGTKSSVPKRDNNAWIIYVTMSGGDYKLYEE